MGQRHGPRQALVALVVLAVLLALAGPWVSRASPVVRLRIVANSDAAADQAAKRAVRDAVLRAVVPAVREARTAAESRAALERLLPAVQAAAQAAAPPGVPVRATLGPDWFPARRLGFLWFPAGSYETLRITLGAGQGHNWWTVLFPPLAFVRLRGGWSIVGPSDGDAAVVLPLEGSSQAVIRLIDSDDPEAVPVEVRFALWEIWRALWDRSAFVAAR